MKIRPIKERGQALVIIVLAVIGLVGIVGLAVDGSAKFSDRRHAQNAADAAALAAALVKVNGLTGGTSDLSPTTSTVVSCPPPSGVLPSPLCEAVQLAGLNSASANGYNDNLTSNNVEVYSPPITGYYVGNDSYVQVVINSKVNTYLARVIGIGQTQNKVEAVAYLKEGGELADGAMIISYDPSPGCSSGVGSGGGSVDLSGNATVNLNGGGIFLNSDETCGYSQPSCTATLNIFGGGGINSAGVGNVDLGSCGTATPNYNQPQVVIPDDVYFPDRPAECSQTASAYQTGPDQWHITPGYYVDFPQSTLNGNDLTKLVGNKKDIIMDPGVYCVGANIRWSGNTFKSLDGSSGVTIYMKSGYDFDFSTNSPITLYSPRSGDYQGYLIIQEGSQSNIGSCIINGGTYIDMEGLVYAPYCNITVNGGSEPTAIINAQLIGWDIKINGNNTINFNYDPSNQVVLKRKIGLMR